MATSRPSPAASTMKAIQIHEYGDAGELKLEDAPRPVLHPGQVLVKVRYAGVNPVDWKIRAGRYKDPQRKFPFILGQDFSGEIAETAGDTDDFESGERVFGFAAGTYAEYTAAPITQIAAIPDQMNFATAAALPTAGLTALQLIRDAVAVKPGQRVLIDAAAGAVGSIAAQIAKGRGAEVIGMASGDDLNYVRSLGLAVVIDYKKERFEDRAGQVDAVVDLVGGETLARAYAIVKKGGVIVTSVYQMDEAKARAAGIRGTNFKMKWDSPDLVALAEMVQSGKVKPRMGRTLPLAQAAEAQSLSESGQAHGKLLLEIPT